MTQTGRPTQPSEKGQDLPSVSAVIPAYNAAETIERALNSVYAQTYPNITEVIVVDDGSTDTTAEVVAREFPQVTLIRQENQGNAAARNRGVEEATGEYIAFLDADDEWFPNKLEVQVPIMLRHPGIGLLTCWYVQFSAQGKLVPSPFPHRQPGGLRQVGFREWVGLDPAPWAQPSTPGMLFRRAFYLAQGGMETLDVVERDWEFLVRLAALGYTTAILCQPLYKRHRARGHLGSRIGPELRPLTQLRIISRYHPITGELGDLLTEAEYDSLVAKLYFEAARKLWEAGEHDRALGYFRQAASLANRELPVPWRVGLKLAAISPRACVGLLALLRRARH